MLKEHPELSHGSSIDHLHQLRHLHVLIALKRLERHVTLMCELLKDVI